MNERYSFVSNRQEAALALASGGIVDGNRGIGKTTALVDIVAVLHGGRAVISTSNQDQANYILKMFEHLYGHRTDMMQPGVYGPNPDAFRGHSYPVYIDNFNDFKPEYRLKMDFENIRAAIL